MFYQKLTHQYGSSPGMAGENAGYDSDEKSDDYKHVGDLKQDKFDAMSSRSDLLEFIPLSPQLISIVRSLDYKSDEDMARFKEVLTQLCSTALKMSQFKLQDAIQSEEMLDYLEAIVFVHRMFALVDVPYDYVLNGKADSALYPREVLAHLAQLASSLVDSDGLNYVPATRSQDGRLSDVAFADARALVKHLVKAPRRESNFLNDSSMMDGGTGNFNNSASFIDDSLNASLRDQMRKQTKSKYQYARDVKTPEHQTEQSTSDKGSVTGGDRFFVRITSDSSKPVSAKVCSELDIKNERVQIVACVSREFMQLQRNARGKADLYFHAYFWLQYLEHLHEIQRSADGRKQDGQSTDSSKNSPSTPPKNKGDDASVVSSKTVITADERVELWSEEPGDKHMFMKRLSGLSQTLQKVIVNIKKYPFTQQQYDKYVRKFAAEAQRYSNKKTRYLEEIQKALFVAQIAGDKDALYLIEKLLIQLMGFCDISVRDQAVVLLNMLYDEVDWQLSEAFRPVVRSIGQHFIVNVTVKVHAPDGLLPQLYLGLAAPTPTMTSNKSIVSWHKIEEHNVTGRDSISCSLSINFGKFWKCGFYDWRIVEISDQGRFSPCEVIGVPQPVFPLQNQVNSDFYDGGIDGDDLDETNASLAQGRFIVHARGMRDHTFHEVQVDYQNATYDKNEKRFVRRGSFADVEAGIDEYARQGVTALYVMGTLERDNGAFLNKYSDKIEYRKDDASALAVTSRDCASRMLGGDEGLCSLVRKAKRRNIKIIVDSLARISSSRHHRKYRNLLLHHLDEDGCRTITYGTDGQAQRFQDTAMLNYRKVESWDLLIDEIISYASKIDCDGIHLDNGQAWPQIMEPDLEELRRLDIDGEPAYTAEDLMAGEIVIRNENHGYWNTNVMETYANPFFIKLARRVWQHRPNFMLIGECWGGFRFENRQIIMARSGVIPRLFNLPVALSTLFGKKLHKDGRLEDCPREKNVATVRQWYNETRRFLPEGTILLQSSTAHSLPYPAHLYGKGTWAAIDVLYFMPDVPITFMGEVDGEVLNIGSQTIFQHRQADVETDDAAGEGRGLKKSNSKILLALQSKDEAASFTTTSTTGEKRGLTKVSSRLNIAEQIQTVGLGSQIAQQEQSFRQNLDPSAGYDLNKIKSHYLHRRRLRRQKMVLRYGDIYYLSARHASEDNQRIEDVLCYARYSLIETVIIATNLTEEEREFQIDFSALLPTFKKTYQNSTVIMVRDCLDNEDQQNAEAQYYFLREFLEERLTRDLGPYRSLVLSLQIVDDDQYIFKKCLTTSIERMKKSLSQGGSIEHEQISLLFSDCIETDQLDLHRFANVVGSIQMSFLDKLNINFDLMFKLNRKLTQSIDLSSRLFAMSSTILERCSIVPVHNPVVRAVSALTKCNNMGPIVFSTPELGRWSTVGGLGVMVDELSIGLVDLGQDVTVISPYYERNRKGQTGYLASDPAGFRQIDSIQVQVNGQTVGLGVHEAVVRGVKVVFLHNGDVFPSPYGANGAGHVVFQLAVFNKGVLEYCCRRSLNPSIIVTNDWFTGLSAGYAKKGFFGTYFNSTKFIHICHNLQETYEGRIHPHNHEGDLNRVHELPREWFSDHGNMINPSKCALSTTDQWATVSLSYRDELLHDSSLKHLLHQKSQPFAFPNGIPIADRIKRMDAVAPDHQSAKRKIQMKYFNFQDLDDSIPLFAFVGRITAQKGVHLILDVAEQIIQKTQFKVQFLVGGPANMGDPYAGGCARKMWDLKNKYPHCFWAAPDEFFTDGSLVNRGTDFGLMPSAFEPGGIVQHEFFVGKTPVIAFKTGGLKDSVIEFKWDSEEGSGFSFEHHNQHELSAAIDRALSIFKVKEKYAKLRENAFRATMDGEVVCKAWLSEFCRLSEKNFVDQRKIDHLKAQFANYRWTPQDYEQISIIQEIFGQEKRLQLTCDIDQGATEKMDDEYEPDMLAGINGQQVAGELDRIVSAFDKVGSSKRPQMFLLHNRGPKYRRVQLCGSMDDWQVRHDLQFDAITNQWFTNIPLKVGQEYLYKYIINEQHWVVNDEEPSRRDAAGNQNNYCGVSAPLF